MSRHRIAKIVAACAGVIVGVVIALDRELDDSTKARQAAMKFRGEARAAIASKRWEEAKAATSRLEHQILQLSWIDWAWWQVQLKRLRYEIRFHSRSNPLRFERRVYHGPNPPEEGPRAWWLIQDPS